MAIRLRPSKKSSKHEDNFIDGAPDANAGAVKAPVGVMRGSKRQITVTIAPKWLAKLDKRAKQLGMTRASMINRAIVRMFERGDT